MAVALGSVGTHLTYGSHTNSAIAVPSGVAANDVILVWIYVDDSDPTISLPTGFTELTFSPTLVLTGPTFHVHAYWKRATSADTGTYTFTHATATTEGGAVRYTGALTSGTPVEVLGSAKNATSATGSPAVSGTTSVAGEMLSLAIFIYATATYSSLPAGFTTDQNGDGEYNAHFLQSSAGATGSLTATASASNAQAAGLVGIKPDTAVTVTAAGAGTATISGFKTIKPTETAAGTGTASVSGTASVVALARGTGTASVSGTHSIPVTLLAQGVGTAVAAGFDLPVPVDPATAVLLNGGDSQAALTTATLTTASLSSVTQDAVLVTAPVGTAVLF